MGLPQRLSGEDRHDRADLSLVWASVCRSLECPSPDALFFTNTSQPFDRKEGDILGATLLSDGLLAIPFDHDRPATTGDLNDIERPFVDIDLALQSPPPLAAASLPANS